MGQYCDSKVLEKNWFNWLLSTSVPCLEEYRKRGVLWTKVISDTPSNSQKTKLPNPRGASKIHCLILENPIYIRSNNGILDPNGYTIVHNEKVSVNILPLDKLTERLNGSPKKSSTKTSDIITNLADEGYIKEVDTDVSWHAMLDDINKMCHGIAIRFKQPSEEEHTELANEALLQVIRKLVTYKLVYTPGLAPVFNLLTTTIHRCMYSIMNKRKTQKMGLQKFCDDVQAGAIINSKYSIPQYITDTMK